GRVLLSCRAVAVEELQPRLAVEAVGGRVDAACGTPEQLRDRRELGGRGRGGVDCGVEQPGDRCTSPRLPAPPPPERAQQQEDRQRQQPPPRCRRPERRRQRLVDV